MCSITAIARVRPRSLLYEKFLELKYIFNFFFPFSGRTSAKGDRFLLQIYICKNYLCQTYNKLEALGPMVPSFKDGI